MLVASTWNSSLGIMANNSDLSEQTIVQLFMRTIVILVLCTSLVAALGEISIGSTDTVRVVSGNRNNFESAHSIVLSGQIDRTVNRIWGVVIQSSSSSREDSHWASNLQAIWGWETRFLHLQRLSWRRCKILLDEERKNRSYGTQNWYPCGRWRLFDADVERCHDWR